MAAFRRRPTQWRSRLVTVDRAAALTAGRRPPVRDDPLNMQRFSERCGVLRHPMHEHEREPAGGIPRGPLGYRVCDGCGVAGPRRLAKGDVCTPPPDAPPPAAGPPLPR